MRIVAFLDLQVKPFPSLSPANVASMIFYSFFFWENNPAYNMRFGAAYKTSATSHLPLVLWFNFFYHTTTALPTTPINIQTHVSSAAPTKDAAIEGFVVEEGVAAAPAVPLLVVEEEVFEPEEVDDPDPPTGPPVPLALTVPVQVDTETPVLFLHGPGEAEDRKVMSAQL